MHRSSLISNKDQAHRASVGRASPVNKFRHRVFLRQNAYLHVFYHPGEFMNLKIIMLAGVDAMWLLVITVAVQYRCGHVWSITPGLIDILTTIFYP